MADYSMHRDENDNPPPRTPPVYPLSGPVPKSTRPCSDTEHPERAHHHMTSSGEWYVHRHPGCPFDCAGLAYQRPAPTKPEPESPSPHYLQDLVVGVLRVHHAPFCCPDWRDSTIFAHQAKKVLEALKGYHVL